jgi:hypothetical protein
MRGKKNEEIDCGKKKMRGKEKGKKDGYKKKT